MMPRFVLQSRSRTITSWATSTRRLVRYPESAVFKSGIDQTLSSSVTGDDVLGNVQAFPEVGFNRQVDDLTLRVCHQTAHADELADLGDVTSGSGERHHVHGIETVEVVHHFFGQLVGGGRPGIDHFVVAFDFCNFAALVASLCCFDFFFGSRQSIPASLPVHRGHQWRSSRRLWWHIENRGL